MNSLPSAQPSTSSTTKRGKSPRRPEVARGIHVKPAGHRITPRPVPKAAINQIGTMADPVPITAPSGPAENRVSGRDEQPEPMTPLADHHEVAGLHRPRSQDGLSQLNLVSSHDCP